jgi:hypothetical protein
MIALVQADDHTDAGIIVETNSGNTTSHTAMGFANSPDVAYCRLLNSSKISDLATTSGVHVVAVVWDHGTSLVPDMWLDKTKSGPIAAAGGPPTSTCAKITLGNRRQNTSNAFGGKIGIFALYAKALTEQEVFDLTDLCNTWAQTGAAPSPGETSGTFGAVETNDDASATFQWEESSNGTDWANVGTILTDISGATTNELTVNSATLDMDGTQVRARATDGVTTAYSNPATLTVVAP